MASIRKREQVGENGRRTVKYDATVTRRGARRQTKTFLTKSAAEKWARKVEGDIDAGGWTDPTAANQMTVARALDIYLAEVVPHLKSGEFEPPKADSLKKRLGKRVKARIRKMWDIFLGMPCIPARAAGASRRDRKGYKTSPSSAARSAAKPFACA